MRKRVDAVHTQFYQSHPSHIHNLGLRAERIGSETRKAERDRRMGECRPLGFLIGLPFALIALVLAAVGAVIWILGSILSCICPCCFCCSALANLAMKLIRLPVKIIRWFTDQIPC
ncbi:signaling peptide TAXIMIN 2-like [Prosopis cineraria]|uniref:signaling peptide TAXIMIN 2-like n=1 Tax=Prosopis cineraria TaxID=364024 RepID=UPI00240FA8C1|nr:signaling peptide TAXIMIN 2-like [Prosopis cineraria]